MAVVTLSRADRALWRATEDARRSRRNWAVSVWLGRLCLLAGLLGGWELAADRHLLDPTFTSKPSAIARAWWQLATTGSLWHHTQYTLTEFAVGFALGALLGVLAACLLTLSDLPYRVLEPYLLALYGIPKLALGPLIVLWFGVGLLPKIVLAAMMTFFLVYMNTVVGIRSTSGDMVALLRVMGATRRDLYRRLILPHALPYTLTALRLTIPIAIVGAVLGEFLGATGGLGYLIYEQVTFLAVDKMMAAIATLAAIVLAFRLLLLPLERSVNRHHKAIGGNG
ncbi:MAG TPA: ABC transporter permease [Candidatus Dormibacteraeota bacterium]|jgi:NitT/TauT family transport system permease protein|nr:ABC transporter permease [Candidatus Dormibacteraeota bacterium]